MLLLLKLLRRALALGLGSLLLSDSLLLGGLAGSGTLLLKVVNELLALCKGTLKEAGGAGANRRECGSDVGMRRRRGKLCRKIGIALVEHALRVLIVIVVGGIVLGLDRSGGGQNIKAGGRVGRGRYLGLDIDRRSGSRLNGRSDRIGRGLLHRGSRLGLKRRLLALIVIECARLRQHAERTDGIRTKANVAGGIAIELGLGLDRLDRRGLLRRLGSGRLLGGHFGLHGLALSVGLSLGRDCTDQRRVGRSALETIDLFVKRLILLGLDSKRLAELVLGIAGLIIFDRVAIVVLLLRRRILGRGTRHFLGTALLLAKIRIERNVIGKLVLALVGSDVVHNAKQGGNRRLVAHRAGRVGKHKAVGNDICRVGERHQRSENRNDPQQDLKRSGERQNAQNGDSGGNDRRHRQQLCDQRAIGGIGLAGKQLGTGRIIVGHHDHGTVARRSERTRSLVIGDDILAHARFAQA